MTAYKRDGSWEWATKARNQEIKEIMDEYNQRAKYCKLYHNGTAKKQPTAFSVQFSWYANDGDIKKTQYKRGIGVSWSKSEAHVAIQKAETIDLKLRDNSFTFAWLDEYIKGIKPMSEMQRKLQKPLGEMIAEFRASKNGIKETTWKNYQSHFDRLLDIPEWSNKFTKDEQVSWHDLRKRQRAIADQKPIGRDIITAGLDRTDPDSSARMKYIAKMTAFLKFHEIYDEFKDILEKAAIANNYKEKDKYIPSDQEIIKHYHSAFIPSKDCPKHYLLQSSKWQWLYGLLATYGLRIHEAWNIENWERPVYLKAGQWEVINEDDEDITIDKECMIPAITDPNNHKYWLAISHKTKTGYRVAMPLSPAGHNWVKEFDLLSGYNLPDYEPEDPSISEDIKKHHITNKVCKKFDTKIKNFTPHCLRHAFNHRARVLGLSIPSIAISLGHSENMNSSTYAKHMAIATKLQLLDNAQNKAKKAVNLTYEEAVNLTKQRINNDDYLQIALDILKQVYGV
jgi:integrase